ncbi:MAG: tetratricopeptide repeat protein [Deltaproteobacteria bacterium]|nr:tetratricopeptide repeat protein [Deltaproteobacteria bacterium]MCB9787393.1 tetratricopeptide repeat protein [Deltaproteobacteria bacterium]
MARETKTTGGSGALDLHRSPLVETDGTRTQVAIVVGLFVAIGALTGVAVQIGAFGGNGSDELAWAERRPADPADFTRGSSVRAGQGTTVEDLLAPLASALLEGAVAQLPAEVAEPEVAEAGPEPPAEPSKVGREVYQDLRDGDGRRIRAPRRGRGAAVPGGREADTAKAPQAAGEETPAQAEGRGGRKSVVPRTAEAIDQAAALRQARRELGSGAPEVAVDGFRSVLGADPGNTKARLGLAQALYESNRVTEAREQVKRVLESEPTHGRALLLMASIAQEQGPVSEARAYYKTYLKHYPNGTSAPEVRGILDRL